LRSSGLKLSNTESYKKTMKQRQYNHSKEIIISKSENDVVTFERTGKHKYKN